LNQYDVTAIIRDAERAEKLRSKTGVKVLVADLDSPNLAEIASQFDVVLHTADADHVAGANALVAGLEKRASSNPGGKKPILIHTSGTGVLIDANEDKGKVKSDKIYSDGDLSTYHALPATNMHKNVDDIILAAGKTGKIDAVVVAPPSIWGKGEGEFNIISIQIPLLIKECIQAGHGMVFEQGINTWGIIHVADLSAAYLTILDAAVHGKLPADPNGRVFFVENGEYEQREATKAVCEALYAKGKIDSPEPRLVTKETEKNYTGRLGKYGISRMTGSNSRSRAVLVRRLGWEAKRGGNKEFLESISVDVDQVLKSSS
jgi:nucleoside-diphosphate-sugar epimerase